LTQRFSFTFIQNSFFDKNFFPLFLFCQVETL
jgi:hypothetical protein